MLHSMQNKYIILILMYILSKDFAQVWKPRKFS